MFGHKQRIQIQFNAIAKKWEEGTELFARFSILDRNCDAFVRCE